jgi:hypothetical protein
MMCSCAALCQLQMEMVGGLDAHVLWDILPTGLAPFLARSGSWVGQLGWARLGCSTAMGLGSR